jgi:hypothetical protein
MNVAFYRTEGVLPKSRVSPGASARRLMIEAAYQFFMIAKRA